MMPSLQYLFPKVTGSHRQVSRCNPSAFFFAGCVAGNSFNKQTKKQAAEANVPIAKQCLITVDSLIARCSASAFAIGSLTLYPKEQAVITMPSNNPRPKKNQFLVATDRRLAATAPMATLKHSANDNRRLGTRHPTEISFRTPDSIATNGKG